MSDDSCTNRSTGANPKVHRWEITMGHAHFSKAAIERYPVHLKRNVMNDSYQGSAPIKWRILCIVGVAGETRETCDTKFNWNHAHFC